MSNLVEFLTARLDELEEAAREAVPRRWFSGDNFLDDVNGGDVARFEIKADARHAALYDPVSVLADIAAKRQIVAFLDTYDAPEGEGKYVAGCTLLLLAQPYRDHPDYDPSWAIA